ncbi:MAG TPA: alpha/beta hydrolase [Asticcacaulis sp.]|nr:alpha/beta hydrolase [Asticcacaulis sp.]
MTARTAALTLALTLTLAAPAIAADPPKISEIPAPTGYKYIPLSEVGSPATDQWEDVSGWRIVRNVTQPALIPVLPKPGTANGTAVIIAPGGGFFQLSMDSEGFKVAEYLADRGITAFVLKYRLDKTDADYNAFRAAANNKPSRGPHNTFVEPNDSSRKAVADGLAAMKYVRGHAADYGLKTNQIGFMGFSAGGVTTMNLALSYDKDSRPDFIGSIYGAMPPNAMVPADAPPAFIMVAADDKGMGWASTPIFDAWRDAGRSAELHIYARGAHGFGMRVQGSSSDHWADDFYNWLKTEIMK